VFGDLHAHMIALPLTLLALLWMIGEILGAGFIRRGAGAFALSALFGGLVVGILFPTNSWDWPTYSLLAGGALLFAAYLRGGPLGRRSLVTFVAQVGLFGLAWFVSILPFKAFFATSFSSLQGFEGSKTPVWAYLDMHGIFLFFIVSLLLWQTLRLLRRTYVRDFIGRSSLLMLLFVGIVFTVLLTLFFVLIPLKFHLSASMVNLQVPLAILCIPLGAWCIILFLVPDQSREMRILLAMTALALGISFGVELVVLGGDIARQNTFFKFYMQIWMLLSLAGGVALAWMLQVVWRWAPVIRTPWLIVAGLILAIGALFPVMSTQGKIAMRMAPDAPHTLDGDAYLANAVYVDTAWDSKPVSFKLDGDLDMIHWLEDNIQGTPVIIEAQQPEYVHLGGRVAINTGLPTVLGWRFHQTQQRTIDPLPRLVDNRVGNVQGFYDAPDAGSVWPMIAFYHIEYIIVGQLERTIYPPEGIVKFDDMVTRKLLEKVYDKGGNTVYHVLPGAMLSTRIAALGR
ncbi:MAG TPA: DUF2298 domain-containing protein, partial [Aggregatilineales bacterium]|nr:DUF2298 domain-containing protein [Aggregatilineales bacterium]